MRTERFAIACVLAAALAACGCDPVGRGKVAVGVPEAQLAKTAHPTHNVYWRSALGPAASGDFHAVAIADFDGDGLPDLVGGGFNRRGVGVWLTNGDGTWSSVEGPRHLGMLTAAAAGDVNGDGRPDLALAGRGEIPGVRVWLNNGDFTWSAGQPASITHNYSAIKMVDLNGDRFPDILAARERESRSAGISMGGIAVWMNRDGAGWSGDIGPKTSESYNDLAVADLNGDNHLDVVAARWGNPGGIDIWYGNGRGSWVRAKEEPAYKLNFQGLDCGDFNGDGAVDIVATAYHADLSVVLFINDREGGWWTTPVPLAAEGSFWDVRAVDLNGDGLLDAAATSFDGRGVRVWLQLPRDEAVLTPQFMEQSFRFPHKGIYYSVDAADFNDDGKLDLIAGAADEGLKAWFQTAPDGTLAMSPLTRAAHVAAGLPKPFGELDEAPQDPEQNHVFTTIVRDDGLRYAEYRIGLGDHLHIEIYPGRVAAPVVMEKVVEPSGELLIPLVSPTPLRILDEEGGGLSPSQLRDLIQAKLEDVYRAPAVAVTIAKYEARTASVFGEIRVQPNKALSGPGRYLLRGKTRTLDFIAKHGGFTDRADLTRVEIRSRDGEKRVVNLFEAVFQSKLSQDIVLDDGDLITIPSTAMSERKVYVLGKVGRPGVYELQDNVRLLEAVQLADSFTRGANRKQVIVIRGDESRPELFQINMLDMLQTGDLAKNMLLADGDVVFVPQDWIEDVRDFYAWFLPMWDRVRYDEYDRTR